MVSYYTFNHNGIRFFIPDYYNRHKNIRHQYHIRAADNTLNGDIILPQGQIESIDVKSNILTVVVKTEAQQIKVLVINLKDRVLLYEYSIRTKDDFTVSD